MVGKLAALVQGDDGKGAATAGLPIDGEVLGVDLARGTGRQKGVHDALCLPRLVGQIGADQDNGAKEDDDAHLHQVRVPGIAADVEVVVAELPLRGLPKDVS